MSQQLDYYTFLWRYELEMVFFCTTIFIGFLLCKASRHRSQSQGCSAKAGGTEVVQVHSPERLAAHSRHKGT